MHNIIAELNEKYGEDFNWFCPADSAAFETERERELPPQHPLKKRNLKALAKNSRNDDVLFADESGFFVVHLTWSPNGNGSQNSAYPLFFELKQENIAAFLETDFLEN